MFVNSSSTDDEQDGAAIFWEVNGKMFHFAVVVRADGWVGLGISKMGGMIGSDIAVYQTSNSSQLVDAYIIGDRSMPLTDDCQDWALEGAISGLN